MVDAVQWFKHGDHPAVRPRMDLDDHNATLPSLTHGYIDTLEGGHIVCPGDWIITGVQGEHYPCKPDIFAQTYEAAE